MKQILQDQLHKALKKSDLDEETFTCNGLQLQLCVDSILHIVPFINQGSNNTTNTMAVELMNKDELSSIVTPSLRECVLPFLLHYHDAIRDYIRDHDSFVCYLGLLLFIFYYFNIYIISQMQRLNEEIRSLEREKKDHMDIVTVLDTRYVVILLLILFTIEYYLKVLYISTEKVHQKTHMKLERK